MSALLGRLRDEEDRLVERKPERAGNSDFKRTIVAFANSVPAARAGVMFIGVGDNGDIHGVAKPDDLQKSLRRLAESDCYPPIYVDTEVLRINDRNVVAVVVQAGKERPYFAGHAYVRQGSQSIKASEEALNELILRREDLRNFLLEWKGKFCSLTGIGKQPGVPQPTGIVEGPREYVIEDVTTHFVRLRSPTSGLQVTEPIKWLTLAWDDKKGRPWLVARIP